MKHIFSFGDKPLFTLLLSLAFSYCYGETYLNIKQKSGEVVSICLKDKPILTYKDDVLCITSTKTTIEIPLANIDRLENNETATNIANSIKLSSEFKVYDISGRFVLAQKEVELGNLPSGIYVLKNKNTNLKIMKK